MLPPDRSPPGNYLKDLWKRGARWSRNRITPGGVVLCYHRIVEPHLDPTGFAVSPAHFEEHLQVLTRLAKPMALSQLGRAVQERQRPARAVAITLDDGYLDNLTVAHPLLSRYDIPATFFVTTGIVEGRRFYWDRLKELLLHDRSLPAQLELTVAGRGYQWFLDEANKPLVGGGANVLAQRNVLFKALGKLLLSLPAELQDETMAYVTDWAGSPTIPDIPLNMSKMDIQALATAKNCEIGAHTVSHPSLVAHSHEVQRREMEQSKRDLESWIGQEVTSLAYPFGDWQESTIRLAGELGFQIGCGLMPLPIRGREDPLALPRYILRDCDGEELARSLRWLALG